MEEVSARNKKIAGNGNFSFFPLASNMASMKVASADSHSESKEF